MKKLSLLFATLMVLVSSIVFCACDKSYKNLKISCNVEEIKMVLDADDGRDYGITQEGEIYLLDSAEDKEQFASSYAGRIYDEMVEFRLSGAKSWGKLHIGTKPAGMVESLYDKDGKSCKVFLNPLQPVGDGASLVITHLGSGKTKAVPLTIGMKLQSLANKGNDFVLKTPEFDKDLEPEKKVKEIKIPTKQLVLPNPFNHSDDIVWQPSEALPVGVRVLSYTKNGKGEPVEFSIAESQRISGDVPVETVIRLTEGCQPNTTFSLMPVSILGTEAVLHDNITINVKILDLLSADKLAVCSDTHQSKSNPGELGDLVLISNPDPDRPRGDLAQDIYDYFSTALIQIKSKVVQPEPEPMPEPEPSPEPTPEPEPEPMATATYTITDIDSKYIKMYEMTASTNLDGLTLENKGFGQLRVIATSTCMGDGIITLNFIPKNCVGDIEEFSIDIPCKVGERATGFKATNNGKSIQIDKDGNDYTFESTTNLRDSRSLGQEFVFNVLSTNTLEPLTYYTITIDKGLLRIKYDYNRLLHQPDDWATAWNKYYIYDSGTNEYVKVTGAEAPTFVENRYYEASTSESRYIRNLDNSANADLSAIEKYNYQIAILIGDREITFYENATPDKLDTFVSEPIRSGQPLYIKWVLTDGTKSITTTDFGFSISNIYEHQIDTYNQTVKYDIANHGFEKTILTYDIVFDRQRTVERVEYVPVKANGTTGYDDGTDYKSDWQFYFEDDMLNSTNTYYGIHLKSVMGINNTPLTEDELNNINLEFVINGGGLGFAKYDRANISVGAIGGGLTYRNGDEIEKTGDEFNFYTLGDNVILIGKLNPNAEILYGDYQIRIMQGNKEISVRNVKIYKRLQTSEVEVSLPNADFNGTHLNYTKVSTEPNNWSTVYSQYYEYVAGHYVKTADTSWNRNKTYYEYTDVEVIIDQASQQIDTKDAYIVSTGKEYVVDVKIPDAAFVNIGGKSMTAELVSQTGKVFNPAYTNNMCGKNASGQDIVTTGVMGTFDTAANIKNYVQITYQIEVNEYDYYKPSDKQTTHDKVIYLYVYEPLTFAQFDHTMLYKYNVNYIETEELKRIYGTQVLNIEFGSRNVLNYIDVQWKLSGDGLLEEECSVISEDSAKYVFANGAVGDDNLPVTSNIIATITQFGAQYVIYCGYNVTTPILSQKLVLNNPTYKFNSGKSYLSSRVGESLQLSADLLSDKGDVSINELEYFVCSTAGYVGDNVASVDNNGLLTAQRAGRATLIVVAKDALKRDYKNITNYLKFTQYINGNAYAVVDVLVADGSEANPYLIADAATFKAIANDTQPYNYALVNDINLNGIAVNLGNFKGSISSFQERGNERYTIYGVMLNKDNPNLFTTITAFDTKPNLKNINFHIDVNYETSEAGASALIGLIGSNLGIVQNITIKIDGTIDVKEFAGTYKIGAIAAQNGGSVIINNAKLVGVEGKIVVKNGNNATIILGGAIGENTGTITGANTEPSASTTSGNVEYAVYYGNQGATTDIELQVMAASGASCVGGVIGQNNNGKMTNVYATGKVLGINQANELTIDNVGGLIGKNNYSDKATGAVAGSVTTISGASPSAVQAVTITGAKDRYQVVNSYSSAVVMGKDNVGGAIGYDEYGAFYKMYYEIYFKQESVKGHNNVGGLIGYTKDSNLMYCYANDFAWGYEPSVEVYSIVGNAHVGGLIGVADSSRNYGFVESPVNVGQMNIVSSLASVTINAVEDAGGLIGQLNNYGAIYTAYYYGVITATTTHDIATVHIGGAQVRDVPYNHTYAIVNGQETINQVYTIDNGQITIKTGVTGFDKDEKLQHNSGKPYIVYSYTDPNDDKNTITTTLVTIIPTVIEINQALSNTYYTDTNGDIFVANDQFGEYVWDDIAKQMIIYNAATHAGWSRYTLIGSLVQTNDTNSNPSDYRAHALVLYYYQFSDMSGENALNDSYAVNSVDMHKILNDAGIIVLPNTHKRFSLKSSNNNIVSILNGGKLLLRSEGQATITLTSVLNPNVSASFVVIVRTKVLEFNLYSNANLREEYNVKDTTISIVKNSSKLLYADYSSVVHRANGTYEYIPATNMEIDFTISYNASLPSGEISDYIKLNSIPNNGVYTIPYGTPITISVYEYVSGKFTIKATPYIIVKYTNGAYSTTQRVPLSVYCHQYNAQYSADADYYTISFDVVTKKGATAINTSKTQLDMMPADETSNLDVKISTDMVVDKLYLELSHEGEVFEVADPTDSTKTIKCVEMLDVTAWHIVDGTETQLPFDNGEKCFDISNVVFDSENMLQSLMLKLKLNEKSHYVDVEFRLGVKLRLENGISTTTHIDVKPQTISSIIALNYRVHQDASLDIDEAYLSDVIRPGTSNIIIIDMAPSIAVYDYIEIVDTTAEDTVLFRQVKLKSDGTFEFPEYMDDWTNTGIKLQKLGDATTSKIYVVAKLPLRSTANITHTIKLSAFDKNGNELKTSYLNLEAVMYPTVEMIYTYPNGKQVVVNTNDWKDTPQKHSDSANLALGVEAPIDVTAYNIDEGTLQGKVVVKNGTTTIPNDNFVKLEYAYGKYYLRFNDASRDSWNSLIGKKVEVVFTASKELNGIIEICEATISFDIRRMVIHGVSMTREGSNGKLYGDWGEEFTTQFYFDKTDISYYNSGYWNIQYTIENTNIDNISDAQLKNDISRINSLLREFNTHSTNGLALYLVNNEHIVTESTPKMQFDANSHSYSEGNGTITITNKDYVFAITAKQPATSENDINNKKLAAVFKIDYDGNNYPQFDGGGEELSNEYGFDVITKTTPFDQYENVSTAEDFITMQEGRYYILTNDITLTNYTPINTAIGAFSGNGYTITIESFNVPQLVQNYISGGMYVGLFGTLPGNSVIQNLHVRYNSVDNQPHINLDGHDTIRDQHTNNIYFGGIAGFNLGVITNVRVTGLAVVVAQYISPEQISLGGIAAHNGTNESSKIATITNSTSELEMSSMALIGGVSGRNYGKITNTVFKGKISSNATNEYAANIFTAGFVVENISGAYISLSYVDCGLTENVNNIHSVGRTAGFVFDNAGTINNSYINHTRIRSQGNIGGFVYQSTGEINNCYSYPTLGNSLFYKEFIHASDNAGNIKNCYVVTTNDQNISVDGLTVINPIYIGLEDKYVGFMFSKRENGVWKISDKGPMLPHAGFNSNRSEYNNIYNIYDIETFDGWFTSRGNTIEGKNFRFVRDIDFASLEANPSTFNKILRANIEGNDMAMINYNIYKSGDADNIGLFARIQAPSQGMYVRNLILQPASIKASGAVAVGALAGVIDSADIYNIIINNSEMLVLGKNAVGGLAGIIKGDFEIVGINSNVSAFATYDYGVGEQYNLYTGRNVTSGADNLNEVSYAGAIAGIVNGHPDMGTMAMDNRNVDNYYSVKSITLTGDLVLIGETIGGAFGLVGERTMVSDIDYSIESETQYQGVYVAGGLVGENRGIIQNAHIYTTHIENQDAIDTSACFDRYARVNGGIVGVNIGGIVLNSVCDIDIKSTIDLATVGGIVGRNIEGSVYNCTTTGLLDGYFVGGTVGTDYNYQTIIQQKNAGFGVATQTSRRVYENVKSGVKYTSNLGGYDDNYKLKNNVLSHKFIQSYINRSGRYYSFNTQYNGSDNNSLVVTSAVFGLTLGLTDGDYYVEVAEYSNYVNKLTVSLKSGEFTENRKEYELIHASAGKFAVKPLYLVAAPKLNTSSVMSGSIIYIVGYDNASYDFWSASLGYTDQFIVIVKQLPTE